LPALQGWVTDYLVDSCQQILTPCYKATKTINVNIGTADDESYALTLQLNA